MAAGHSGRDRAGRPRGHARPVGAGRRRPHRRRGDTVHDGEHGDLVGNTVAHVRGGQATTANMRHIARHNPSAVLRRITADRQMLAECCDAMAEERQLQEYRGSDVATAVIRNLAERYGWT